MRGGRRGRLKFSVAEKFPPLQNFPPVKTLRLIVFLCLIVPPLASAGEENQIAAATSAWREAIDSRDAKRVAALYDPEALLYATFQSRVDNPKDLLSYFKHLAENENLKVKFHRQDIRCFSDEVAINSGLYTFSYTKKNGEPVSIPARYTLVYMKENGTWKIIEHHSSVNPEK